MPITFAIGGIALALTSNYWSFTTIVLYGLVGYLLGSVLDLRKTVRRARREIEEVSERLARLVSEGKSGQKDTPSDVRAPEKKPDPAPAPASAWKPLEVPKPAAPRPPVEKNETPVAPRPPVDLPPTPRATQPPGPVKLPPPRVRERNFGDAVSDFFTKGNVFAKMGAVLLFFGVAFLIKLVAEQGLFPLELRLLFAGAGAFVLIALGWRLRAKNANYAVILQGTGFGVFYLTVFGAFRIWNLLPAALAFGLVTGATVLFSLLSIIQSSKALAALALLGGFSAPVLISTGSGNHIALFSYYALLNLGIALIAKYRPWRELNLIGFFFTYGVGTAWGIKYYTPEHFMTVEPFLIFYFVLYVSVALFFSKLQMRFNKDFIVDATLVFGVPIATFALQARLVKDFDYGLAISAAVFGGFYVALATVLYRKGREDIRLMVESFLASGICFTILAVPFALNNAWTSAVWALQGAFLVWVSVRQKRPVGRYFGMALQFLASVAFFTRAFPEQVLSPVTNAWFLGSFIIFASCLFIAFQFFKKIDKVSAFEKGLVGVFVAGGVFWWLFGTVNEVPRLISWWYGDVHAKSTFYGLIYDLQLLVAGLSFLGFFVFSRAMAWPHLRFAGYGLVAVFLLSVPEAYTAAQLAVSPNASLFGHAQISAVLLAIAAFIISRSLYRSGPELPAAEKSLHWIFLVAGYFWWILGPRAFFGTLAVKLYPDVARSTLFAYQISFVLGFLTLSCLVFRGLAPRLKWLPFTSLRLAITTLGALYWVQSLYYLHAPGQTLLQGPGLIAWPLAFFGFYWLLRDGEKNLQAPFNGFQHFSGYWLFSVFALREVAVLVDIGFAASLTWPWVALLGTAGLIILIPVFYPETRWPFGTHRTRYLKVGLAPLLFLLVVSSQSMNLVGSGDASPLPFIPLLNPVDLVGAFTLLVVIFAYLAAEKRGLFLREKRARFWIFLGILAFNWLTMGLIRSIHHLADIPWDPDSILGSHLVQAALSIFWGTLSLFGMIFAHKKGWRGLWVAGTVLLSFVVLKLFLVDLNESGTMERVVSFIGAGILLLLTGYFAPIPPSHAKTKELP